MQLSRRQKQILIGKILGDGCLEKNGNFVRLRVDHGESQKKYVFWLYQEFLPLVTRLPSYHGFFHKKRRKIYYHWRFDTRSLPIFSYWRNQFYCERGKFVPETIYQYLNDPLSLAVWYMDDGFRRQDCRGVYLCTSGFSEKDHFLLRDCLRNNFQIDTGIHFAAGNARIYIPASHAEKFCQIIKSFILPTFSYKLL